MQEFRRIGTSILSIVFLMNMAVCFCSEQQTTSKQAHLPSFPYLLKPVYAQFINSSLILKGDSTGLSIWDFEKGQTGIRFLPDLQISAMLADPHKDGRILIAAENGDVYLGEYLNNEFKLKRQNAFDKTSMGFIKTILFHSSDSEKLLVADQISIAICKFENSDISIERIVSFEEMDELIVFAFPDNLSEEYFLISGTRESRFRGKWSTGEIVNIPEKKLEYGYKTAKGGISYFARGENDMYLNIRFIPGRPTSIIKHPGATNTYFASTIGISPLKFSVSPNNYYVVEFLSENTFLTFSMDIDRHNPQRMLFTTARTIQISENAGLNWRNLK